MWMFARGGGSGDKVLAARKEQGQVLIVILCAKQLPHADWLLDVQRVNAQPPAKMVCNLHHGIVRRSLHARYCAMSTFNFSGPLCLSSGDLSQLPCTARAEDCHDAKTTIEQYHRICDKSSHGSHATCRNQYVVLCRELL